MSHTVIVGGFGSSNAQMERVTGELAEHYPDEDFVGIPFREALYYNNKFARYVRGATVLTHSAGMVALRGTSPRTIEAIAPPLPTPLYLLVARAGLSSYEFAKAARFSQEERVQAMQTRYDTAQELLGNARYNMGKLAAIAAFNSIDYGVAAQAADIPTTVAYMDQDRYFPPTKHQLEQARQNELLVVKLTGVHEEFFSRSKQVMDEYRALVAMPLKL